MKNMILTLAVAVSIGSVTTVFANPESLQQDENKFTESFKQLSRDTAWEQKEKVDLQFNTYHPQGMTKIGDLFYMSSVEIIEKPVKYDEPREGYDRSTGRGIGHLFVFNQQGELLKDIKLGEGDMYHPGGIAFDGESIWVSVAEYRPNSESIIYKVDPNTMKPQEMFRTKDHIGGILRDGENGNLKAVSWGSRRFYEFNQKGKVVSKVNNPSHFIDYQDCESAGKENMICSGITELPQQGSSTGKYELGGLALLDMKTLEIEHELPISLVSSEEHNVTRNPVYLENKNEAIKLYAVPDDDKSSMLVYQTKLNKK
ncbi:hypothetical protein AWM68_07015 [Fictibacillus phosphorivorans]|uniref:Phytase-like domain-containing protein n=1 Tax=Fictibacillus phosphorivorans TaxID=1221500 RepID=A0A163R371_9BACL|nr:DUF6454 family protein [Fictibacillus phosphorivorans]KZE66119.1 hypothetical protein AWM68_07015 [Fictibacillus phosphorivorans]